MSNFHSFKPRSAFKSDSEYAIYYRDVVRPGTMGDARARAEHENHERVYAESRQPTTEDGKERQKNEKLLAGYKESLRLAQRDPLGSSAHRIQSYEDLIAQMEATIKTNDEATKFKASKPYQSVLEQAQAIRALAPGDAASQSLVTLAFESFERTQDVKQFQNEVNGIIDTFETSERYRLESEAIESHYANWQTSIKAVASMETKIENAAKIDAAKGNTTDE